MVPSPAPPDRRATLRLGALAAVAAALAAACGAGISSAGGQGSAAGDAGPGAPGAPLTTAGVATATPSSPPAATASTTTGPLTTAARVTGVTVVVTVSLTGPATYRGGCAQTLEATLVDASGTVLAPTPGHALHCFAIVETSVAAGDVVSFQESLSAPRPGVYGVSGTLNGVGAIPQVSVAVTG